MATVGERLLELKKEIEHAKLDKASAEGALKQDMARLKDEFKCRTLESAEEMVEKLKAMRNKLTGQITSAVAKLEEKYEW